MIVAPDGSRASYDAEKTRRAYGETAGDPCACAGCRNYRAAWTLEMLEPDMVRACAEIGIDPSKPFETTALESASGRVLYDAQLPFFGEVLPSTTDPKPGSRWGFMEEPYGTGAFAPGLACITFMAELPWVLPEPNPYVEQ